MSVAAAEKMNDLDPIVSRELPVIEKIIRDETWLEGERRRCAVAPTDPVVRENVCQVILRVGRELRASCEQEVAAESGRRAGPAAA